LLNREKPSKNYRIKSLKYKNNLKKRHPPTPSTCPMTKRRSPRPFKAKLSLAIFSKI